MTCRLGIALRTSRRLKLVGIFTCATLPCSANVAKSVRSFCTVRPVSLSTARRFCFSCIITSIYISCMSWYTCDTLMVRHMFMQLRAASDSSWPLHYLSLDANILLSSRLHPYLNSCFAMYTCKGHWHANIYTISLHMFVPTYSIIRSFLRWKVPNLPVQSPRTVPLVASAAAAHTGAANSNVVRTYVSNNSNRVVVFYSPQHTRSSWRVWYELFVACKHFSMV